MSIPNEAIEAAAKAIGETAHTRDFRAMAEAALEAAKKPLLKQKRKEARSTRAEENRLWAEQTRQDKAEAWNEGCQAQWEAEMTGRECRPNPYEPQESQ